MPHRALLKMDISAPTAFRLLNGIFTVYKPPRYSLKLLRELLLKNICTTLNSLEVRPIAKFIDIQGEISRGDDLTVKLVENYADNPLVVGPRYQEKDFVMSFYKGLDSFASGVTPIGIGPAGCHQIWSLVREKPISTYEIKGRLGFATVDFTIQTDVREKSRYDFISKTRLDLLLNKMEGIYRNSLYHSMEHDINSDEAYKLASKSLIKPKSENTIIYSIKCIHFQPPDFVIEVQCLNEDMVFVKRLAHDIGIQLKSDATTLSVRRSRLGYFTAKHALLPHQCSLQNIIEVIRCNSSDKIPEIDANNLGELDEDDDSGELELEDFETEYMPLSQDYAEKPQAFDGPA